MNSVRRRLGLVFSISLLLGVLSGIASLSNLAYRLESHVLDYWFELRYKISGSQEIHPDLVLVGIDSETINYLGKPTLFWQQDLAKLIDIVQSQSAKVVGLDFVISPYTEKLDQDGPIIKRIQDEGFALGMTSYHEVPILFAEILAEDLQDQYAKNTDNLLSPYVTVLSLLQREGSPMKFLGSANVPTDPDGSTRRLKIVWSTDAQGQPTLEPQNISLKMLVEATGIALQGRGAGKSRELSWNGVQVPFLFDDSFLINYPGPIRDLDVTQKGNSLDNQTFPIFSGVDILEGRVSPEQLKQKIVLICPLDSSLNDIKVIPGDSNYPGGGTHLSVLNMFLTNSFISRPAWLWVSLCGLFALVGCSLGGKGQSRWLVMAALAPFTLSFLGFWQIGVWLPAHFSTMALSLGAIFGYLERLLTVERERRRIRSTFGRMVSPQVMKHVLSNPSELKHGQRQDITVLFSDINGFTTICEQHDPEDLILMLSDYFSGMVDVIMKYDGYIKQYVGDEIMVIFGAPEKSEDHATKAILAAIEMRQVLETKKQAAAGKPGFYEVKIGINSGSAIVGKVGPETRWEYAAVGDCVNLGARVMSKAKELGTDIGVSADTRERFEKEQSLAQSVSHHIPWVPYGVQSFKGKVSQMEVFGIADQRNITDERKVTMESPDEE